MRIIIAATKAVMEIIIKQMGGRKNGSIRTSSSYLLYFEFKYGSNSKNIFLSSILLYFINRDRIVGKSC